MVKYGKNNSRQSVGGVQVFGRFLERKTTFYVNLKNRTKGMENSRQTISPKRPNCTAGFRHCPIEETALLKLQSKQVNFSSCTLFINATMTGACLHFRAANTNTSSPRGHNHHKHGVFIDKLPTPPYLIHKIFIHLIFTQPKYLPPIHYTAPTISPTYLPHLKFPPFSPSLTNPKNYHLP